MACTWICSFWTRRWVELEVFTEEAFWTTGVEVGVGTAMERRTWARGGLSKEETINLSKSTRGWEAGVLREPGTVISQEKVMFSMSWQRDSFA